jgi:hypothetical protein
MTGDSLACAVPNGKYIEFIPQLVPTIADQRVVIQGCDEEHSCSDPYHVERR